LEELLAAEARSLLVAAANGIPIQPERLRTFAAACLEVSEVGRLALGVLEGGVFAPRRGLELARVVGDAAEARSATRQADVGDLRGRFRTLFSAQFPSHCGRATASRG
jgi:hypothetical protein